MYLKEIETRPAEGMAKIAFKELRDSGEAIPEILHLFRFKRRSTDHLVRFTEEVMRGPSPLSPGIRELIDAHRLWPVLRAGHRVHHPRSVAAHLGLAAEGPKRYLSARTRTGGSVMRTIRGYSDLGVWRGRIRSTLPTSFPL